MPSAVESTSSTSSAVDSAQRWRCTYFAQAVLTLCGAPAPACRRGSGGCPAPAPRPRDSAARAVCQRLAHDVVEVAGDLARELAARARVRARRRPCAAAPVRALRVGVQGSPPHSASVGRRGLYGLPPVSSSYSTTPSEYTSVMVVTGSPRICSGAAWCRVNARSPVRVFSSAASGLSSSLAMPKSSKRTSSAGDQDVRRLQVAVHDQVRVRVADRVAGLQEQREALRQRRLPLRCPVGDRFAVDVFQREVGLAVLGGAGVEQARDVGVFQPRQDLPLAGETQAQVRSARPGRSSFSATRRWYRPSSRQAIHPPGPCRLRRAGVRAGTGRCSRRARAWRGEQRFAQEFVVARFLGQQRLEVVRGRGSSSRISARLRARVSASSSSNASSRATAVASDRHPCAPGSGFP